MVLLRWVAKCWVAARVIGIELQEMPEGAEGARGTVTILSGSRELTVQFLSTLRLFELVSLNELVVGDAVVVRSLDGDATSVLRVPVWRRGRRGRRVVSATG